MSLRAQSWLATLLLVGGILAVLASWIVPEWRLLTWVGAAGAAAGGVILVLTVRRAARQIAEAEARIGEILREVTKDVKERDRDRG